jgi:hypothetical protein
MGDATAAGAEARFAGAPKSVIIRDSRIFYRAQKLFFLFILLDP